MENIEKTKANTRNIQKDVNFMGAGLENAEEIKNEYTKKVNKLQKDIDQVR